jgi:hypothetical protein
MAPCALKSVSDDLRNLQEFVTRTAPPASGGQATQKKRPRFERGQYCPLEIGHRVSRCPKGMLSPASSLVYSRSQRGSPGGLPPPARMIFSISWRAGVSPRPAARNEFERLTKSRRNTLLVMNSELIVKTFIFLSLAFVLAGSAAVVSLTSSPPTVHAESHLY